MLSIGYRILKVVGPSGLRLASANRMDLCYDCFLGDILISDGDVDISVRWGWIPVLDFALGMTLAAKTLIESEHAKFEFTESDATIHFESFGELLVIRPTYTDRVISTSLGEFQDCASGLLRRVREDVEAKHPELLSNPHYNALFEFV